LKVTTKKPITFLRKIIYVKMQQIFMKSKNLLSTIFNPKINYQILKIKTDLFKIFIMTSRIYLPNYLNSIKRKKSSRKVSKMKNRKNLKMKIKFKGIG